MDPLCCFFSFRVRIREILIPPHRARLYESDSFPYVLVVYSHLNLNEVSFPLEPLLSAAKIRGVWVKEEQFPQ